MSFEPNVALGKDERLFLSPNPFATGAWGRSYSVETAAAIDDELRATVDRVLYRRVDLLRERREILEQTAQWLLEKETFDEPDLLQLAGSPPTQPPGL